MTNPEIFLRNPVVFARQEDMKKRGIGGEGDEQTSVSQIILMRLLLYPHRH